MEYVIGHYHEYFYGVMEKVINNVIESVLNVPMSEDICELIMDRLDYSMRLLRTCDKYLSVEWTLKKEGSDGFKMYVYDSVMRHNDICWIRYNWNTGYMDIDWIGDEYISNYEG